MYFPKVSSTSKTLSGGLQLTSGGVLLHATGKIFESSSSQMQVGKHCWRSRTIAALEQASGPVVPRTPHAGNRMTPYMLRLTMLWSCC